jgi:hypothetical protein
VPLCAEAIELLCANATEPLCAEVDDPVGHRVAPLCVEVVGYRATALAGYLPLLVPCRIEVELPPEGVMVLQSLREDVLCVVVVHVRWSLPRMLER